MLVSGRLFMHWNIIDDDFDDEDDFVFTCNIFIGKNNNHHFIIIIFFYEPS